MERRSFLRAIGAGVGIPLTDGTIEAVALTRSRTEQYLSAGGPARGVFDAWEEAVHGHALRYASAPPLAYLRELLSDFIDLQELLEACRLPDAQKRALRLMGRLSAMVAVVVDDLGRPAESRKWMHLARRLALEIRDRELRAWTFARAGFIALHYAASLQEASRLAQAAVDTAPRRSPAATVMGHTVKSRARAALGDQRGVLRSLDLAEQAHDTAPPHEHLGLFDWTVQQAALSRGVALTTLGLTGPALSAQAAALALFDPSEWLDPQLVRLNQAALLVRRVDVEEGCRLVGSVLRDVPAEHRSPLLASWADDVIRAIPSSMIATSEAQHLLEVRHHFTPHGRPE
ncbi:hypothetical protein FHX78_114246 [Streptomyces capillispiralis]|uniref:Transcriptional regulator n=1 Tax=Streptomyces capillispiralis TaxID=68182 RepID=A0A561TJI5_9ACTN|nr:hypothetical protein FHX78_114246 [Streptomyces capillispiralis]